MDCACYGVESQGRRFLTAQERILELQEYKDWLEAEAKGVAEAIERIKPK